MTAINYLRRACHYGGCPSCPLKMPPLHRGRGLQGRYSRAYALPNLRADTRSPLWEPNLVHKIILSTVSVLILTPMPPGVS